MVSLLLFLFPAPVVPMQTTFVPENGSVKRPKTEAPTVEGLKLIKDGNGIFWR